MISRIAAKRSFYHTSKSIYQNCFRSMSSANIAAQHFSPIRVTFTDDDSRMTVDLPSVGPTWIVVDKTDTFGKLKETIQQEDTVVEQFEVLDSSLNTISGFSNLKVQESLEDPYLTYFLKINGDIHEFDTPTLDVHKEARESRKTSKTEGYSEKVGSDETISAFLNQAEDILYNHFNGIKNKSQNKEKLSLAKKYIYNLYLKKIEIERSIADLDKEKKIIDKKAQFRTNLVFTSYFMAFLTEFLVGYYCIYEVDWLGWDLVEPVTYSLAQGQFVIGTWFFCKYLSDSSCADLNSFFKNRIRKKMYKKRLFEFERLEYLKTQLKEIESKIEKKEREMLY
ncbi:unnamed protein product [Moneuplotes crassus]|uniref:Calcium uniporter protein C-terminal domain-containing protein n=2 Tax=Euplotes crassus TaxID=5936 RepID=A0AAD1XEE5_EUPCR|nr:unnamed protein product [Moneuplotes crassus]